MQREYQVMLHGNVGIRSTDNHSYMSLMHLLVNALLLARVQFLHLEVQPSKHCIVKQVTTTDVVLQDPQQLSNHL